MALDRFEALLAQGAEVADKVDTALAAIRDCAGLVSERLLAVEQRMLELGGTFDPAVLAPLVAAEVARLVPPWQIARDAAIAHAPRHSLAQTASQVERRIDDLTARFVGRDAAWSTLDTYADGKAPGILLVCAGAGGGKSALLANWTRSRIHCGARVVRHFISNQKTLTTSPAEITGHLLAQISAASGVASEQGDARGQNLYAALKAQTEPLLVVLDGLDEAASLLEPFVEPDLPSHVRVIVSARADPGAWPDYLMGWQNCAADSFAVGRLDLEPMSEAEVLLWLEDHVGHLNDAEMTALAAQLRAATDGLPLYLSYVLEDLAAQLTGARKREERLAIIGRMPAPFSNYLSAEMARPPRTRLGEPRWTAGHRRLFALLSLLKGPMRANEIADVLSGVDESRIDGLAHRFTRWLTISGEGASALVSLAHSRLAAAFAVVLAAERDDVKPRLIDWCLDAWKPDEGAYFARPGAAYPLDWLTAHLVELHDGEQPAAELLADGGFLVTQLRDFSAARRRLAASLDRWAGLPASILDQPWAESWTAFWADNESAIRAALDFDEAEILDPARLVEHALADAGLPGRAPSVGLKGLANRPLPPHRSGLRRSISHPHPRYFCVTQIGNELLSWGGDNRIRRYSETGQFLHEFRLPDCIAVYDVEARDGHLIVRTNASLGRYSLFGDRLAGFEGATLLDARGALFLLDQGFATSDSNGRITIWSSTGVRLCLFEEPHSGVGKIVESDGRYMSRGRGGDLKIWDSDGTRSVHWRPPSDENDFLGYRNEAQDVVAVAGGFLSRHNSRRLLLWHLSDEWCSQVISTDCEEILAGAPTFEDTFLIKSSLGLVVQLSVVGEWLCEFEFSAETPVRCSQVKPTLNHIFGFGYDSRIAIWSTRGDLLQTFDAGYVSDLFVLDHTIVTIEAGRGIDFWPADEGGLFHKGEHDRTSFESSLGGLGLITREVASRSAVAHQAAYMTIDRRRGVVFWDASGEQVGHLENSDRIKLEGIDAIAAGFWGEASGAVHLWDHDGKLIGARRMRSDIHSRVQFRPPVIDFEVAIFLPQPDVVSNLGRTSEAEDKAVIYRIGPDGTFRESVHPTPINRVVVCDDGFLAIAKDCEGTFYDRQFGYDRPAGKITDFRSHLRVSGDYMIGFNPLVAQHLPSGTVISFEGAKHLLGPIRGSLIVERRIIAWDDNGAIHAWALDGELLDGFGQAHSSAVYAVYAVGQDFVSVGADGVIWRWSADGKRRDAVVSPGPKHSLAFSPTGDMAVAGRALQIYPVDAGRHGWSRRQAPTI